MGLLQNIERLSAEPVSYVGGLGVSCITLAHSNRHGVELSIYASAAGLDQKGGFPYGYSPPSQIIMPMKAGGMSTAGTIRGAGAVTVGLTKGAGIASGSPRIMGTGGITANAFLGYYCLAALAGSGEISTAAMSGAVKLASAYPRILGAGSLTADQSILAWCQAVIEGIGATEGTMELPIPLAAALSGDGSITSAALIGLAVLLAEFGGSGAVTADFRTMAQLASELLGEGDLTNPALQALAWCLASLSGDGEVEGGLRGESYMASSITSAGELVTAQSCAAAVWNAIAAAMNEPGSMGEQLNAAGTAGDPWLTPLPGSYGAGTAGKIISDIPTAADINAEMVDALSVDTYAEPGQGAPPSTLSVVEKIGYLFKSWLNQKSQDADFWKLFNAAGDTVDQQAVVTKTGGVVTKEKIDTGV